MAPMPPQPRAAPRFPLLPSTRPAARRRLRLIRWRLRLAVSLLAHRRLLTPSPLSRPPPCLPPRRRPLRSNTCRATSTRCARR